MAVHLNTLACRAAWVVPILGRGGKLMYVGPLLAALKLRCDDFVAVAAEYGGDHETAGFSIRTIGRIYRYYRPDRRDPCGYYRGFVVIGPSFLRELFRLKPDLLILSEFSVVTIYGIIARMLSSTQRVLLLVESRPIGHDQGISGRIRTFLRRRIARRADAILTNNEAGYRYLVDALGVNKDRIKTQPYLVSNMDTATDGAGVANPAITSLTKDSVIEFLYVGELIRRKGLQDAIEAAARLSTSGITRFRFHVVGDGPFRKVLEEIVKENGLCERIVFHGRCEYADIPGFYRKAHVFLFPTHKDYRALSPFEALSAGLPILASIHDGGIAETVIEGVNGFRFDPDDHDYLAQLISGIIENSHKLVGFSVESRMLARNYTLENAVNAVVTAGNSALSDR